MRTVSLSCKHCMLVVVQADLNHYSPWRASVLTLYLLALISIWLLLSVMFLFYLGHLELKLSFLRKGYGENRQSFQNKALMMKWIFKNTLWLLCVCVFVWGFPIKQPVIDLTDLGFPNDFVGTRWGENILKYILAKWNFVIVNSF